MIHNPRNCQPVQQHLLAYRVSRRIDQQGLRPSDGIMGGGSRLAATADAGSGCAGAGSAVPQPHPPRGDSASSLGSLGVSK
jgi:hypothetical protein